MSVAPAADIMKATDQGSYDPRYVYRNYTVTFNRARYVYLLVEPDGELFVMHSLSQHVDPTLSEDN